MTVGVPYFVAFSSGVKQTSELERLQKKLKKLFLANFHQIARKHDEAIIGPAVQ